MLYMTNKYMMFFCFCLASVNEPKCLLCLDLSLFDITRATYSIGLLILCLIHFREAEEKEPKAWSSFIVVAVAKH